MSNPMQREPIVLPALVVAVISGVLAVWGINIEAPSDPVAAPIAEALEAIVQVLATAAATAIAAFVAARRANTISPATNERFNRESAERLAEAEFEAMKTTQPPHPTES